MTTDAAIPSIESIREQFPSLASGTVFLENAGGSQVPECVISAMVAYMRSTYVQIAGEYQEARQAAEIVRLAHEFVNRLLNGEGIGGVVFGSSSTSLLHTLSAAYAATIQPGDEIVVANSGHEADIGCWERLERQGARIVWWHVEQPSLELSAERLKTLVSARTRIVAFPHVSNILGVAADVPNLVIIGQQAGARVVVDGVAHVMHGPTDVRAYGADWYVYSPYKVYGPHMGAMFGTFEAFGELVGPNHFFIPKDAFPNKWELGGPNHEGCAGLLGLGDYIRFLAGRPDTGARAGAQGERSAIPIDVPERDTFVRAFQLMEDLERPLTERLLGWLRERDDLQIVGPDSAIPGRIGTVSFLPRRVAPQEVVRRAALERIGIRYGHAYSVRILEHLGIEPSSGVVRVSLLHYNTMAELDRLIEVLEACFE